MLSNDGSSPPWGFGAAIGGTWGGAEPFLEQGDLAGRRPGVLRWPMPCPAGKQLVSRRSGGPEAAALARWRGSGAEVPQSGRVLTGQESGAGISAMTSGSLLVQRAHIDLLRIASSGCPSS